MEWYDAIYDDSIKNGDSYANHWVGMPNRLVTWYPALLLASGPIFEIGCGPGHLADMCVAYGKTYVKGIDYSSVAIKMAKKILPGRFQVADALACKCLLDELDYETVVILEVLEHVFDDLAVISGIPVGKEVVASVPNFHTEGHARWFANTQQVKKRYSRLLDIDCIVTEEGLKSSNNWFIFRGVRR